ncbi:uncharacterized protein LOC122539984 [Chiloscyllium plagiosum]|uniref:uncharacterized protein LOC122539984 n=1 Tax=Chiloscyllium plagiosum TaxID=36176 RepID=UPI001CB8049A|nr:uncharacterized protein LOC122539984 [Chiloscyllium plagiosum]
MTHRESPPSELGCCGFVQVWRRLPVARRQSTRAVKLLPGVREVLRRIRQAGGSCPGSVLSLDPAERLKSLVTMCRSRGSVSSLLLSFVLCLCRSLHGQRPFEISPPVNLSITSYNFHTVLKWDVIDPSRNMRFNVKIKDYSISTSTPFLPCLNISTRYCDLSDGFLPDGGKLGYYAQVNAVTETQKSDFVSTNRFTFNLNASIGPPDVKLKADNTDIIAEVYFMLANSTKKRNAKILNQLSYNIYWHSETSKLVRFQYFQVCFSTIATQNKVFFWGKKVLLFFE